MCVCVCVCVYMCSVCVCVYCILQFWWDTQQSMRWHCTPGADRWGRSSWGGQGHAPPIAERKLPSLHIQMLWVTLPGYCWKTACWRTVFFGHSFVHTALTWTWLMCEHIPCRRGTVGERAVCLSCSDLKKCVTYFSNDFVHLSFNCHLFFIVP